QLTRRSTPNRDLMNRRSGTGRNAAGRRDATRQVDGTQRRWRTGRTPNAEGVRELQPGVGTTPGRNINHKNNAESVGEFCTPAELANTFGVATQRLLLSQGCRKLQPLGWH
ncbi:MAG TPA: hypothetical protein VFO99_17265, partial [Pyrinomonadaceae bacterium]|nr:hypothetical protein [Pyrinomonadaceae bacterium]